MSKQQIGVVGMAVMGRNLALNIESRGYTVSIFNRSRKKTEEVVAENPGKKLVPYYTGFEGQWNENVRLWYNLLIIIQYTKVPFQGPFRML
ncbi:hypothetical protein HV099_00160 [Escherichia coli]|nr:hypothetical protein [Escherichia coli]